MDTSDIQGDETVSLSDVLVARDTCLPEDELWALCRECCLVLEVVNNSPDMFQTLCVTPDTVAFDQVGNVCFLDLDVDPEPIYLPPEYSTNGNSYKAHLFSLGMTLLYAAEYNVDQSKEAVSAELREVLGRMTADETTSRPDLESTIILCEEQLCGQSSQEVCCGIAAIVGFGLPQEVMVEALYWKGGNMSNLYGIASETSTPDYVLNTFDDNTQATVSYATDLGVSPDADSYMQSEQGDATCCDDIPDLTEDVSQAESLPLSEQETVLSEQETLLSEQETLFSEQDTLLSEQGTVIVTETTESHDDSLSEEQEMNRKQRKTSSSKQGLSGGESFKQNENLNTSNINNKQKPSLPKKPDINFNASGQKTSVANGSLSKKTQDGELVVSELFSESESDQSRKDSDKSVQDKKQKLTNGSITGEKLASTDSKSKDSRNNGSNLNRKDVHRDSNQNITYLKYEEKTSKEIKNSSQTLTGMSEKQTAFGGNNKTDMTVENGSAKNKRNKRKQGLTVSDILDALERNLAESELWALCKEGTAALQRKKKHLPAYLSPDTLVIRESGNVSFKAIPEEKPLEVIFMAPELQKKGELSEKTCLFGLSVTLRCAAGKKYSSVSAMSVSSDLKDLLQYLADSNPVKRPELVDIAKVCNEHNNGTSSDSVCAKLFQEAYQAMNEKEEASQRQQKEAAAKSEISQKQSPPSAFKPAGGSSFQPVKPAPVGGASGGAFCPVPKKISPNKENTISEPRIPSAFSSPATHFKPIILQQTSANEKPATVQEEKTNTSKEKSAAKSSVQTSQKKPSPDPNADKEKEVVKKLKELKKNLMKHKQPSMAKEIENEDKVSDTSKESTSKSSTPNKKSLPPTPKKSSSKSSERKRRGSSGALDALLKEIQKQGNVPDTHSLASAIAGVLHNHLNQGDSSTKTENQPKNTGDLDMTVTSAQASLGQGQTLQNLNIPSQYHSQLLGQTMTLPGMQYGGNVYSGLPQFQFQQDPVTGFLQLVPVVAMRPQSVHSNSGSVHSARDFTSPTGSSSVIKDINSPEMSPKAYHNQSDLSNQSAISDPSGSRGKAPHGRTAKDLVQKTANLRAKNLGRPSPSNLLNIPRELSGLQKWKSDHALDRGEAQFYSDSERFHKHGSFSSLSFSNKLATGFVFDDSMLNANRNAQMAGFPRPNGGPHYRSPEEMHRHILNSTASSPSPSTHDSGIGGMNHGIFRGNVPGSDATLMDRLLNSNENGKQQRILGKIVHLLREEFAFDGYMENGVEDLAMAEYISSLGVLKWETFKSAISEKYSDIYWHDELLKNLYAAVNSGRPPSGSRGGSGQSRGPAGQRKQRQAGNQDDDSSGLSETNEGSRKTTHERLQPQLSPLQGQQRLNVNKNNQHADTSDSTDTENYGKRRRIKTKHELDKMKSSSNSNLLTENSQPTIGNVINMPSNSSTSVSNNQASSRVNLPQSTVINRQHSVDNMVPLAQNSQSIPRPTSLSASYDSPQMQTLRQNSAPGNALQGNSDLKQNNLTVNGLSSPQRSSDKDTGLSREMSLSSHSSSQSDLVKEGEGVAVEKRGHVVYHWAMIQLCMSQEMERFMQDIDEQNHKMLLSKLSALSQEIKMEKRSRKRTQKFYKSLVDTNKNSTFEVSKNDKAMKAEKTQLLQVAKDITEMTRRIVFIDLCKTHIQMLLAELQGIDVSYLHSIAISAPGEPLHLQPRPDNPLLQFQTLREPHTGCEIQALHAGTPEGLMAYLFASTALSDGYIHQFLFCYRYFTTATEVMTFLINKFAAATKVLTIKLKKRSGSTETNISRLKQRTVDLLHYWLEGYYSIDFQGKPTLVNMLRSFIKDHINDDSEGGQSLLSLLSNCSSGNNLELSSADPDEAEMHFWQTSVPKVKWESFKALVRGKSSAKEKAGKVTISAVCVERRRRSMENPEVFPILQRARRTDTFMLADYTAQCLAEQLCLIEQAIFQRTHPVHYLDSKSRGVGVALTMKGMKTPAMARRSGVEDTVGLFVEPLHDDAAIQKMIDHAQEVSHWVAGEIVACSNPKTQIALLSKFLFIGHACVELRNFATSMAILDGLENLIVKQLPAWKSLPAKCTAILDELCASRMFLKNDPLSLMQQDKDCHLYPTIPSAVIFLLHIQQLEIGGFRLANQMYKWGKIRSICQVIDQIRVYREHMYGFEADHNLEDTLRQRIHQMSDQDIHDLAAQHDINYQKMSSGSGISGAFKKMKGKFQSKS
ncbi:kinase non-catalytic C-lobe domain-containing protein 1-like isoform X3 [Mercenaria mercenaria]|uniref:kinase non-catalytic C-lobe domain-containing protein 1-like isoform X3 n=1 Tax=Mercenaria mercenaria TaxID=6596 RepID=UPI00234ED304|nr:kinase non-catalytic C-lobe domain-containing protein 1-like isoform X3 [Mercenaria mercenaria]